MVKSKKTLIYKDQNLRITLDSIETPSGTPHDYGLSRSTWQRAARLVARHGADQALELLDQRAERAVGRRDIKTARRWRDVMAAIHAIITDEKILGDKSH
jgi:hypothetical protein